MTDEVKKEKRTKSPLILPVSVESEAVRAVVFEALGGLAADAHDACRASRIRHIETINRDTPDDRGGPRHVSTTYQPESMSQALDQKLAKFFSYRQG